MALIYKITNTFLQPEKSYIGMTTRTLQERYDEHISSGRNIRGSILLAESLRKYGTINHTIEILEECDNNIALQRESYWMEKLNTIQNGFNVHLSNIEKKEKTYWNDHETAMENISKGFVWNKNISPKNETRRKISDTRKERYLRGMYNNYGHLHDEKTKKHISDVVKKQYKSGRRNSGAIVYKVADGLEESINFVKMDKIDIMKKYNLNDKNWKALYKWSKENLLYSKDVSEIKLHPKFKLALIDGEKYYVG